MNESIFVKGYCTLFGILLFSLPFSDLATSLPNIILTFLIILFPFCINKTKIDEYKNSIMYLYLALVLYTTINIWIFGSLSSEISQLGKLFLPIGLFILSIPLRKYFKELKILFVLGVFLAICISLTSIFIFIFKQGVFNFTSGKEINEVLILERVYIAFLCVLSFVFSLDLFQYYRKIVLVNISVLILFILLIAARMALISIVLIAFFYMIKALDKRKILLILGLGCLVFTGFFIMNKNLQNRFFYKNQQNSFVENLSIWEPRMVIWPCVFDITQQENYNYINGLSSYSLGKQELVNCYERTINNLEKKKWFLFIKYNSHNQFFDFLIVSGLLGFFGFILIFIVSFWKNRGSFFSISLILSFLLFGLVENYLHRQVGAYCFGIFLIFVLSNQSKTLNNYRRNE